MPRHAIDGGLGICCSPAQIAPSPLSTPPSGQRGPHLFPAAPNTRCSAVSLGSAVEPFGTSLARSTSSAPLFTLFALPTSLLYLAPSSAPQLLPALPRYRRTPRSHGTVSIFPGKRLVPPPSPCDSRQLLPQPRPEHAVIEQSCLARVKLCLANESNVSATCTADVTAPLANSSPKSRLALAVEPPDQPPRYPPF